MRNTRMLCTIIMVLWTASSYSVALADSLTYTYDDLNRLASVTYSDGTVVTYSYDEVGNRTLKGTYKPPVASFYAFNWYPYGSPTGCAPLEIGVDASQTTGNPTLLRWEFGDGTTLDSNDYLDIPPHTYTSPGIYSITLTASNPAGSSTVTRSNYIDVQSCP